jgi:hypothetical protein
MMPCVLTQAEEAAAKQLAFIEALYNDQKGTSDDCWRTVLDRAAPFLTPAKGKVTLRYTMLHKTCTIMPTLI